MIVKNKPSKQTNKQKPTTQTKKENPKQKTLTNRKPTTVLV